MESLAGTSLTDHALAYGEVLLTHWRVKSEYQWDTGVAVSRFLSGLKEGKILATHCPNCGRTLVPPRVFCEVCFKPLHRWVELEGQGTVNTFSVSFVNWDATRRQVPQVPAVIEIEGATPGMGILHLLGEVGETLEEILERVKIGMKVRAVWKTLHEREGSINDIRYFKPAEHKSV